MAFPLLPVQTIDCREQSLSMAAPVPRPAPTPIAAPMSAWRLRCPGRCEETSWTLKRERVWSAPLAWTMMASSVTDWNWPLKDFLLSSTTRTCWPGPSCLRLLQTGFSAPRSEELVSRPRSGCAESSAFATQTRATTQPTRGANGSARKENQSELTVLRSSPRRYLRNIRPGLSKPHAGPSCQEQPVKLHGGAA
jgi:hypothetical protein